MKMFSSSKMFSIVIVLVMVLSLMSVYVPNAYSVESDEVLTFLTDVVRLDMTKYNAKLVTVPDFLVSDSSSDLIAPTKDIVKYTLESNESKLDVICIFRNNSLVWCKLYPLESSPIFVEPSTKTLNAAKSFLDRYQVYSGRQDIQPVCNVLDKVNEFKPVTKTIDDVKLKIKVDGDSESFEWMNAVNGITNNNNAVTLRFRNDAFEFFSNSWNRYEIGNAEVNLDKEEAIRKALNLAEKHSWTAGNTTVSNVSVAEESILAYLEMQPKSDNRLYPIWGIRLGLDEVYPGGVTEIGVALWADTGEVAGIGEWGYYGVPSAESPMTPTTEPLNEPEPVESEGKAILDPTQILIAISLVMTLIIGLATDRKKKK